MREMENISSESEFSLVDIVELIKATWKLILGAGIAGAVLGLAGWFTSSN